MKKADTTNAWESLPENIRGALVTNTLISLKPEERILLYTEICKAKGLDPATRPFEFITLNGKLTMYARKECADQLRERNNVSAEIVSAQVQGEAYVVHIRAKNAEGRIEDDIGATGMSEPEFVNFMDGGKAVKKPNPRYGKKMEGVDMANAMMKAVTKGKRRVTLAICGLGMFDESEIEGIAEADKAKAPTLEEVQRIAARVRELKEQAAKGPKNEAQALIREACALESTIIDLPGSGHTVEDIERNTPNTPEELEERMKAAKIAVTGATGAPQTPPVTAAATTAPVEAPKPVVSAPEPVQQAAAAPAVTITGQTGVTAQEIPLKTEPAAAVTAPAQPAAAPAATAQPALATEAAAPGGWRDHVAVKIPHRDFKGKKMGEVSPKNLKTIYDNWVLKFVDEISKNPEKIADAAAVTAAVKELGLL